MSSGGVSPGGGGAPTGAAGGDLGGTYPNPTVDEGAGFPAEWTAASDGGLVQAISDNDGSNTIRPASMPTCLVTSGVSNNGDATGSAHITVQGIGGGATSILAANGNTDGDSATLSGYGGLSLFTTAGQKAIDAWDAAGNVQRFGLLVAGQIMTGVVAAPADGALAASQLAFWFDDNNAAPALKIKAKTVGGSVVTATVLLT